MDKDEPTAKEIVDGVEAMAAKKGFKGNELEVIGLVVKALANPPRPR